METVCLLGADDAVDVGDDLSKYWAIVALFSLVGNGPGWRQYYVASVRGITGVEYTVTNDIFFG